MRRETTDDYARRTDLYDDVGEVFGEKTRSGAIDGACEVTTAMIPALQRAVEQHPDISPEFAERVSTPTVEVRMQAA